MYMAHIIYYLFAPVPVYDNISRWSRIMLENNDILVEQMRYV